MGLVAAFGPIWILTAAGYLARRLRLFSGDAALALSQFVFHLAIPADLFLTLAKTPLSGYTAAPIGAFAASTVLVIGAGWLLAWRFFGRKPGERAIWGMAAGYVNSANLGIPIAMQVLGNVSFIIEVLLFQTLIVTPVILTVLDRYDDAAGSTKSRRLLTLPLRNPVILASALGVIASATHFTAPTLMGATLKLLGAAAVPTALIALGASLYRPAPVTSGDPEAGQPPGRPAVAELSLIAVAKLLVQPVLGYLLGAFVFRLSHADLVAVVVCAGLPTAQNTFVYAQMYRTAEELASRSVLITTTLSLATVLLMTVIFKS
jgi:malonate transporter and related proteins